MTDPFGFQAVKSRVEARHTARDQRDEVFGMRVLSALKEALLRYPGLSATPEVQSAHMDSLLTAHRQTVAELNRMTGLAAIPPALEGKFNRMAADTVASEWRRAVGSGASADGSPVVSLDGKAIATFLWSMMERAPALPNQVYADLEPAMDYALTATQSFASIHGAVQRIENKMSGAGAKYRPFFLGEGDADAVTDRVMAGVMQRASLLARQIAPEGTAEDASRVAHNTSLRIFTDLAVASLSGQSALLQQEFKAAMAAYQRKDAGPSTALRKALAESPQEGLLLPRVELDSDNLLRSLRIVARVQFRNPSEPASAASAETADGAAMGQG